MKNNYSCLLVIILIGFSGCKGDNSQEENYIEKTNSFIYYGVNYKTTTIGTQEWTIENFKTSKYSDGSPIINISENLAWVESKTGAYCFFGNDNNNIQTYGYLYNYYAVVSGKLAPSKGGWRIPTDSDWNKLCNFIGDSLKTGSKLRSKAGWYNNSNGTDDFSFNALPGGYRGGSDGSFADAGKSGNWWSSTLDDSNYALYREIYYANTFFRKGSAFQYLGFSVRLVRDK